MSAEPVIIVAETDPLIRDTLRVAFSESACAVLMAANATEAEELTQQVAARLVVLDVARVKYAGYAACARIRRQAGYGFCPIVLTLGEIRAKDRAAAKRAGASALLEKPYSVSAMVQAVTPHLAPDDPVRLRLPPVHDKAMEWTQEPDVGRRFGPSSGLAPRFGVKKVVAAPGIRIPLGRIS